MATLLGIDVGTSSVKAGVFTTDGRCLALASVPCRFTTPHPGWAEIPAERWWRAFLAVLERLEVESSGCLHDVAALGFSAYYPSLVPFDAAGKPLRSAILYCDGRSSAQVERLAREGRLAEIEARTVNRVVPGTCSATSMLWIRDQEPEIYRKTRWFGNANSCLVHRLCGRMAMDRTNASLTGLTIIGQETAFSPEMAALFDLDAEKLPPIVPATEVMGALSARAARVTGLPAGILVVMGTGDATAAALGAGLAGPGEILYVAGTTDCAAVATPQLPNDPRFVNSAYCLPNLWESIGTMTSTGASVEWFARAFLGMDGTPAGVERAALSAQPGAGGVLFLPYLQGERTPIWDPQARGVFLGLRLSTGLAEQARAVLEGTALGLRQVIETLEEAYGLGKACVTAVGGCTQSRLWMQIKASALGRPLRVLEFQETSALGAALLAGLGVGIFTTPARALRVTAPLRRGHIIHPRTHWQAIYADYYPIYRRLYASLRDDFHALDLINHREGKREDA